MQTVYYQRITYSGLLLAVLLRPGLYFRRFRINRIKGANAIVSPNKFLCVSTVFVNIDKTFADSPQANVFTDVPIAMTAAEFIANARTIFTAINARPDPSAPVPSFLHAIRGICFGVRIRRARAVRSRAFLCQRKTCDQESKKEKLFHVPPRSVRLEDVSTYQQGLC
jgi:hypothetical protein